MSCWDPLGRQFPHFTGDGAPSPLAKAACPLAYLDIQEPLMIRGSRPKVFTIGDPLPVFLVPWAPAPLCQEHPAKSFIFLLTPAITQHEAGRPAMVREELPVQALKRALPCPPRLKPLPYLSRHSGAKGEQRKRRASGWRSLASRGSQRTDCCRPQLLCRGPASWAVASL